MAFSCVAVRWLDGTVVEDGTQVAADKDVRIAKTLGRIAHTPFMADWRHHGFRARASAEMGTEAPTPPGSSGPRAIDECS
jgi:hypothetical protein